MLLHKNNKFIYSNGTTIKIPNNVYLDPCPDPAPIEGMVLYSEDLLAKIEINFVETDKSPRAFLEEGKECYESLQAVNPIRAIVTNRFCGLTFAYATKHHVYEEYAFSLHSDTPTLLHICTEQKRGEMTDQAQYARIIAELIEGIEIL